jgi:hypothetical protein
VIVFFCVGERIPYPNHGDKLPEISSQDATLLKIFYRVLKRRCNFKKQKKSIPQKAIPPLLLNHSHRTLYVEKKRGLDRSGEKKGTMLSMPRSLDKMSKNVTFRPRQVNFPRNHHSQLHTLQDDAQTSNHNIINDDVQSTAGVCALSNFLVIIVFLIFV